MQRQIIPCIGLMSGTSLDGLDIALCNMGVYADHYSFEIMDATTVVYSDDWKQKLSSAHQLSGLELSVLHVELGKLHGQWVNDFCVRSDYAVQFIASHGHTVFHQPEKGMTLQIGSAPHIAAACKTPVVADFRTTDVALGGQGAPLVPIGDKLLFAQYNYCLNLGGIANISFDDAAGKRIAFDICVCNMVMNHFAEKLGQPYDKAGMLSQSGKIQSDLLAGLNAISFFHQSPPKSLGKEFFERELLPAIEKFTASHVDILATLVEHIAIQLSNGMESDEKKKVFITGGGAFNDFLMERLKAHSKIQLIIPDERTVQFKEALIFAFLGTLRWMERVNSLASVTGASRDSIGGAIYL
ncbi:MAG: anhydro-N-acetylmuramic acid kinase [Flavobacteriales bacterium]